MSARTGSSTTREQRVAVLRHLHSVGRTLEECGHWQRLCMSERTLKRFAREAGLAFPDYTPRALKPKKGKK